MSKVLAKGQSCMKCVRDAAEKGPSHLPPARFRVTIKTREIAEKGGAAMIRIALVEDEAEVRAQLQGYVQRHTRQYGTEFAVTEFADGMELLDDYRPVYDVDRKSTRLNSSHTDSSRMPSSA